MDAQLSASRLSPRRATAGPVLGKATEDLVQFQRQASLIHI